MHVRGIILAGGTGSRLWPNTISTSKQLLPVYDKPLIYYPLATLMLAGIREILIITTPQDKSAFQRLLGEGSRIGISIEYKTQEKPEGLAQAFLIGKEFIGNHSVALILGDNIFHGSGLGKKLIDCTNPDGGIIFGYSVADPQRYGVAEMDASGKVISIEEKPNNPRSQYAIPGLYFLDNAVIEIASSVKKSARGELEITSVLEEYMRRDKLTLNILPRGTAWLDCGTVTSLNDASNYIRVIEERQGFKVGCIEEIAWRNDWITQEQLLDQAGALGKNEYAEYLLQIAR
jgi:glucose-1-phosphate thymidylyltransferase